LNILFVCSRNKWRSRTAEEIFKNNRFHNVRSAGTESTARIKVSEKLILWADIIYVMEKKHKQKIKDRFPSSISEKQIIVLDIPDEFQYMDNELIDILKGSISFE
jgi:predicted protein tyrosine phosphatase